MDIFRALSLGTTVRKGGKSAPSGTLPSAGSRANAQLYHDDVGTTRGTKRKRADQGGDDESDDDDASSLDFFAPKEPAKGTKNVSAQPIKSKKPKPLSKATLLDEDECKQILRSHRLKFTLLSAGSDKKSKVKKSKKKAKASAKEVKPEKKQLFPQPLQTFGELRATYNISSRLADNIDAQGYREPTEVQMAGLPLLLDPARALGNALGEDVPAESVDFMGVAPTGSGKTVSFLIPAISSIMKRRAESEERKAHNLQAIIVAPTRELANQIHNEGLKLTAGTGVKIAIMRKGMRIVAEDGDAEAEEKESGNESSEDSEEEEEDEDAGSDEDDSNKPVTKADILVTTPMLLLNFLNRGKSKRTIPSVQSLILDEADVLLDELFREQTTGIWQACTNSELHLTFWSATMGSNIETLATEQLKSHYKQRGTAPKPLIRLVVGLKDTAVPNVTHKLTYTATEPGKLYALRQLLHPVSGSEEGPSLRPPFIVFTQTIDRATALHDELKYDIPIEAGGSARIAVLHSSLSDSIRSNIMRRFRLGEIWVLITTDVLARGVDFAGVNGVVNYDVPTSAAAYVHRAGRTGRAGREGGVAVTLYTKDDMPYIKTFANVIAMSEKQAGKEESRVLRALLDALPDVKKEDKKKLKTRGVETRRTGTAMITSKSAWERKKEHNRKEAIKESRKRKSG